MAASNICRYFVASKLERLVLENCLLLLTIQLALCFRICWSCLFSHFDTWYLGNHPVSAFLAAYFAILIWQIMLFPTKPNLPLTILQVHNYVDVHVWHNSSFTVKLKCHLSGESFLREIKVWSITIQIPFSHVLLSLDEWW
jgi:hypothetical protein